MSEKVRRSLGQVDRSKGTMVYVLGNGDVMERARGKGTTAKKIGHVVRSGCRMVWVDADGFVFGKK